MKCLRGWSRRTKDRNSSPDRREGVVVVARVSTLASHMDSTLRGKSALITGASKGLGKAMALALAKAGASVALVSRDEAKLQEAAAQIRAEGGVAEVFVADVSDEAQVQ